MRLEMPFSVNEFFTRLIATVKRDSPTSGCGEGEREILRDCAESTGTRDVILASSIYTIDEWA